MRPLLEYALALLLGGAAGALHGCSRPFPDEALLSGITLPACELLELDEGLFETIRLVRLRADHHVELEGASFAPAGTGYEGALHEALARSAATMYAHAGVPDEPLFLAVDVEARWSAVEALLESTSAAGIWKNFFLVRTASAWRPLTAVAAFSAIGDPSPHFGDDSLLRLHLAAEPPTGALARYEVDGQPTWLRTREELHELLEDRVARRLPTFLVPDPEASWGSIVHFLCLATPHTFEFYAEGVLLSASS